MLSLYIIAGCNGAGKTTASYTVFVDNSSIPFRVVAEGEKGKNVKIQDKTNWRMLELLYEKKT